MDLEEKITQFRAIAGDQKLEEKEIKRFINMAKGNLEHALNYYFRQQEKSKKKSQKQQPQPSQKPKIEQKSVFDKMRTASIRQKQTQTFIKQVREEYKLPITKKDQRRSSKDKEAQQKMIDEEADLQFAQADYLPTIFNVTQQQREKMVQEEEKVERQRRDYVLTHQEERNAEQGEGQGESLEGQEMEFEGTDRSEKREVVPDKQKIIKQINSLNQLFGGKAEKSEKSKSKKEESQFGWATGQSQICLGQTILLAFAIKFQNNLHLPQGSHLNFRYFIEQDKKKKGFKSKKAQKVMNVRLVNNGSQFGRLKDEQTRILVPLLVHGIIRMQLYAHTIPKRIDYYTTIKVKARVFLLKKAITEPVVQTFQGHSDLIVSVYKPIAEEILALFERLQLKIVTWPLIKRKSKLKSKGTKSMINQIREEQSTTQTTQREKQLERQKRMRSDPFFKTVQKNLTQMMKVNPREDSSSQSRKQQLDPKQQKEPQSAIKKKVLQFKNIDQDKCTQLIDLYEQDLQPYKPSKNFTSSLYNYQQLALAWMMKRQGQVSQKHQEEQLHPLWTQYQIEDNRSVFLNQLTSQMSLKPPYTKTKCLGGILADQMGLGKTVMIAALLVTNKRTKRSKRQGGNLIIVPLTLLSQWEGQIERHTKGLKTLVYYSEERKKYGDHLQQYDVVITTYGTASHQFSRGCHVSKTGLYKYKWDRIVLDEAHYIKGRIIQTAKAVYQLQGTYRWTLTGTPIQNGLQDLFSLIHFIRYTPWAQWQCWSKYILKPSEAGEEDVYQVLKTILKRVFLRRTKQSKDSQGNPIVQLPPKTSKVELLQMNPKERQFYDSIYNSSKEKIQQLQKLGILQARYMQVLQILMRLRQICCHPILFKAIHKFTSDLSQFEQQLRNFVKKRQVEQENVADQKYFQPIIEGEEEQRVQVSTGRAVSQAFLKETIQKIKNKQFQNCLICLGEVQDPIVTSCLHIFCKVCATRQIQQCGICSACRKRLSKQDVLPLPRQNRFNSNLDDGFFPSTKLIALVEHLRKLKPGDKAVVFSQFLGMLDLIEHQLKAQKISYLRMQGSTSHKQRTRIVNTFQKDPTVQIFVVSLKTAGVGLNLVAANKVFLVDPWWNPGVEQQAIERVHRIGQKRSVEVIRFVMDQSIEMRMLQLNTNKKQLSQKVLSHDSKPTENRVEKLKYLMAKY